MKTTTDVELEVRYAETDQMGVVHHAAYLVWFEVARTRLCAEAGRPYADIERAGYYLVVSGVDVTYRGGARYGDVVRVTSWVDWVASRALQFGYEVRRGETLLADARTKHVWVDKSTGRHCRMPSELTVPFLALAGQHDLARRPPAP
ncbi:MAG TPA: thioesterase family protein [Thermoanaerobaculia bacterium]|nr:thioesterase family protein [Thermoanaerobaculia bacterium]